MIIDTSQRDIRVIGDVKEFKSSIDPKNLEFITTLLSSNLYSDPEQSFIREIVSNAWDSHVEAKTTDVPVIISFKDTTDEKSITIRDYGTGLSPERFSEIYRNIGSSTKRESNDYIGCFGIGHLSPFACTNTVYVTSYYNGTAYYYVGTKTSNQITYHQLAEKPTTERNGVEVTIKNISSLINYNRALQSITFFPNIYIYGASSANMINSTRLKRFKNFAAASKHVYNKLLLGNVLYPCETYHLSPEARKFIDHISYTGIVIKFDVGELNITPNRESIIYNSDTIKKIEDRIEEAKAELESIISTKFNKDYDNIEEYFNVMSKAIKYDPVTDTFADYGYRVQLYSIPSTSITYRGVDIRCDIDSMRNILTTTMPNYRGVIVDDKIYKNKYTYRVCNCKYIGYSKILVLNEKARITEPVKLYIKENYNEHSIITDLSFLEFKNYVEEQLDKLIDTSSKNYNLIIRGIYESFMKKAQKLNLETDTNYLEFKKEFSSNKIKRVIKEREAIIYVCHNSYREKLSFKKFSDALDYLKRLKKGIILTNMDSPDRLFNEVAELKGYYHVKARKDIVEDMRKLNPSFLVNLDWLLYKDPMLSVVATIMKYLPHGISGIPIDEINYNIPKDLAVEFNRLRRINNTYRDSYTYRGIVETAKPPIDSYTEYLCLKLNDYSKKHSEVKDIVGHLGGDITTAVIVKTRAYRISGEAYNRIKNNKLIRALCRK